uniref:1-acyl-sn-glycerol-3-phosphate acyltransferase n=1 Tax=Zonotrichia albicollis TaxID=44394 RepID=A0A8D2MLP0_ZONAL
MELMLIQGSQMHQLLMHGLAIAALMPLGAGTAPAQALAGLSQGEEEEEEEAVVFHHHYLPWTLPRLPPVRFLRSSPEEGRLLRAALLPLKRFYGIRMRVRGSERLRLPGPFVIVCNHQASLDLMGMVEVIPERCVPIAKRELLYMGTVGWACWLSGIIFIERQRRDAAIEVITRTASTMRRENLRVWVFPEGTRNPGRSMLPFKRGAFHLAVHAQVPIVPIVISPYRDFFSPEEKRFTSGASWWCPRLCCTTPSLPRSGCTSGTSRGPSSSMCSCRGTAGPLPPPY